MSVPHFRMLARYNTLANERLYAACAELSDAERKRLRQAFFKTIHGTLSHIMVGDRIWLTRFRGGEAESTGLDAILYEDFGELRAARVIEDRRIEAFASDLTEEFLAGAIGYRNNEGKLKSDPADLLVAHFFNHQTHHRGQIHDMLTQTDVAPPVLDMHRVLRPWQSPRPELASGRSRAMLRTRTQGGSPKMTDEELAALGTWVRGFHGVEIAPEKLKDLGRTAGRLERTVRDAAAELPFEAEPATFFRVLDDLAKEGPDER